MRAIGTDRIDKTFARALTGDVAVYQWVRVDALTMQVAWSPFIDDLVVILGFHLLLLHIGPSLLEGAHRSL